MSKPRTCFVCLPVSARLTLLALLLSLGIGALFGYVIWSMRGNAWNYASHTNANLAQALEQSIAGTMESFDRSLQGVVVGLADQRTMALPVDQRGQVLFDNSLQVKGIGSVLVLDTAGNIVIDSSSLVPRQANFRELDYFRVFLDSAHAGLYIGAPVRERWTGRYILPVSRAYHHPDGRLAGVVVGAIFLDHFHELFATLNLGPQSSLTLFRADGTLIMRFPYSEENVGKNVAGTANMQIAQSARSGTFASKAALDGVQRLYAFRHVGEYPLIVSVAQSVDAVLANWSFNAAVLGTLACVLMAACMGLAALFARELQQRQQVSSQLRQAEHDLRTILDNLPSMIGYWDKNLHNRFANHAYLDWFGMAPEVLRGKHIRELFGEVLYAQNLPYLEQALQGHAQMFERTLVDPSGVERHSIASYVPDIDIDGDEVRGIFVQVTDITERKRMEEALFDEKERMRLTLKSIGDAVVCTDAQGGVSYLNPMAERMTGWQAFDAAGHDVDEVVPLRQPNGAPTQPGVLHQALAQGQLAGAVRGVLFPRGGGPCFNVEQSASLITDRHGQVKGAVMVLHDVTESTAIAERMAHLAQYDMLTDLPNRVLLQDRARQALAQARRDGKCLAVVYLDLDGFKQVNDTLGHDAGDLLLVQFARRLQAVMRATDTVSRQGGDEFVVLLPGLEGADQACAAAGKILSVCDAHFDLDGMPARVGLSGGIALFPLHGATFEALARCADDAMYAAKREGRRQFRLYDPEGAHVLVT